MNRVQYTGTNYDEVKALCGDNVLAPYFCMCFTMLSLMTDEGFYTVCFDLCSYLLMIFYDVEACRDTTFSVPL